MNPSLLLTNSQESNSPIYHLIPLKLCPDAKNLLITCSLVIFSAFFLSSFILTSFKFADVAIAGYWILSLIMLILTRESLKVLFNTIMFLFLFAGPLVLFCLLRDNFFQILNSIILAPLLTYHLTRDKNLFAISVAEQLFCVKLFYVINLEDNKASLQNFEMIKNQLLTTLILNLIILCSHVVFLELNSMESNKKLNELEHEKRHAEKTNIYLYSFFHEFRNVVGQIINNIDLLEVKDDILNKANYRNAKVCCRLLINLSNSFLDINKVERGVVEIVTTSLVLKEFLSEIWSVCNFLISKKELKGSIKLSKNLPPRINTDGYRISQVLLNVIANSVKCTDNGAIDVEVDWIPAGRVLDACFEPIPYGDDGVFEKNRAFSKFIDLSKACNSGVMNSENQGVLKFVISDTGCGMSEEKLLKLFQKFEQLSDDTMTRQAGAGLGLYISSSICTLMNGEIRAFSKPGRGTTFVFCIPCC